MRAWRARDIPRVDTLMGKDLVDGSIEVWNSVPRCEIFSSFDVAAHHCNKLTPVRLLKARATFNLAYISDTDDAPTDGAVILNHRIL